MNGTGSVNKSVTGKDPVGGAGGRLSLWDSTHLYPGRRWGMSIDLSACTGCSACVVACQVENNIPVVGRDQVRAGREMHWLRVDRYYSTPQKLGAYEHGVSTDQWNRPDQHAIESAESDAFDPEDLAVVHQVMLCQQCMHAPCEEVCPPMATMHNDEGINVQVYNRCIGTRFCANNCPYKVRRFNYYEYSKLRIGPRGSDSPLGRVVRNLVSHGSTTSQATLAALGETNDAELGGWVAPLNMLLNPEVTVRSKGVMEKCNFCLQRTRTIRDSEKRSGRPYDDQAVGMTTACAQTCPTQAIIFGDLNDFDSSVNKKLLESPHHYRALDNMLNTRPSVAYLPRIENRDPNSAEASVLETLSGHHGPGKGAH